MQPPVNNGLLSGLLVFEIPLKQTRARRDYLSHTFFVRLKYRDLCFRDRDAHRIKINVTIVVDG